MTMLFQYSCGRGAGDLANNARPSADAQVSTLLTRGTDAGAEDRLLPGRVSSVSSAEQLGGGEGVIESEGSAG